ncbi:MAG: 2,3,4,5-tetrahydropyridine-2,6-dicarboxylate N-succinyltransferase, partial [Acetobacter sp.]|nr:2,3,4,5-tetrahydropyridine-2,6-dicarboxylate N-succinyltransferase [Acetobacter sp.]
MIDETLCKHIEELWENRDHISPAISVTERNVIEEALEALDTGRLRVATLQDGA